MSNSTIYKALCDAGMTTEGACAMLGNMMAESGMRPNIAQRGMTTLSDEDYTVAADSGMIDFSADSVGYGLCQWTAPSRKAALLAHAKARSRSVGDEVVQVSFCVTELMRNYAALWAELCGSHGLYQLTEEICLKYERPAINNVKARYEYAKQALDYFSGQVIPADFDGASPGACQIGNPCEAPVESAAFELLKEYVQSDQFWNDFLAYIAGRNAR